MARAGRTGGVDAAREIVSVIGALSTEGDEVNPDAIASRMGKTPEEAIGLCRLFMAMVRGEETDGDELDQLEDAAMLKDISHMPARVKCAELAWRTLEEMLLAAIPKTQAALDGPEAPAATSQSHGDPAGGKGD